MAIAIEKIGQEGKTLKKQLKALNLNSTAVTCTFLKFTTKGIQIPYNIVDSNVKKILDLYFD